jgi:hypothetical protein
MIILYQPKLNTFGLMRFGCINKLMEIARMSSMFARRTDVYGASSSVWMVPGTAEE